MESFFTLIPFMVGLIVIIQALKQIKNKNRQIKKESHSKFKQHWLYSYMRLIFLERGIVKFWSAIWYVPLLFGGAFGIVTLYSSVFDVIFPPLPLKMMESKEGIIKSISLSRKTADSLVFENLDGSHEKYSIRTNKKEMKQLVNRNVMIFYTYGASSAITFDNIIYEVNVNGNSILDTPYSYDNALKIVEQSWSFAKYCLYIAIFSALMIWVQNRKERPAHRLYRMKLHKKSKKRVRYQISNK